MGKTRSNARKTPSIYHVPTERSIRGVAPPPTAWMSAGGDEYDDLGTRLASLGSYEEGDDGRGFADELRHMGD